MSNLRPYIKCTSPVAIHRGSSVFLYPCRHCECCQVSRQKSLLTMLALEESNAKYCYFVNPTYDDANVPAVRVPMDADFGSFAEFEILTPRLKTDKYFEPYCLDYDADIEKSIGQLCAQRDEYSRLYSRSHKFVSHDVIYLLHYPDIQRFIKRFRQYAKRYYDATLRYYIIGEYGTNSLRPHWHLLLFFNSDELARDLERCYYPSVEELKENPDLKFYTENDCAESIHSLWKFGFATTERTDKSAYYYVSGYVTSSTRFPLVLSALSRPHSLHSTFFGQVLDKQEVKNAIQSENFEFFRLHYRYSSKGSQIPYTLWRSYYTRFFPVFTGLVNMSREKVFYLFGLWQEVGRLSGYYRVSNQAQWLKNWFYYYYSRPLDEIPSDIADVLVNLESTFDLCKHSKTPDDVLPIKNVLYASKNFCKLADWLGISLADYYRIWCNFYKFLNLSLYREHYTALESDKKYFDGWFSRRFITPTAVIEYFNPDSDFINFVSQSVSTHEHLIKHRSVGDRYKHLYQ